ncbi:MAG: 30S ribosomal protein S9 [Opitutales bacterium]|jgi:small subunit ribosomal protein S9
MSLRNENVFYGTGRRKTASARVRIFSGSGKVTVNNRELAAYLKVERLIKQATAPLVAVELASSFDVEVAVAGGGPVGQAGAIALGIARALQRSNAELRPALKKPGYLSRDPRAKERKKPGRPGARRRFQFSKR